MERIWAFDGDDLQAILNSLKDGYTFCTLPENIPMSMRDVDPEAYPANADVPRFWSLMRKFVRDYLLAIYLNDPQNLFNDVEMQAFFDDLAGRLKIDREKALGSFDGVV